ncbi:hypothetical protein [Pseudomonas sp.]|uniref:hypothetical protein n=1 Tax=Pseudomonas sp. TaxID=306 RepID=UPI0028B10BC6|nr:hypothetical protein [Pseudomonas sp.]
MTRTTSGAATINTTSIGNNNIINLEQGTDGFLSGFTATQTGDTNQITAIQRDMNVSSAVEQQGNANSAQLQQYGVSPKDVDVGSVFARVTQYGDGNTATVEQSLNATARLTQNGNNNSVTVDQGGLASIYFGSAGASLTTNQWGDDNIMTVSQSATSGSNSIIATQDGNGNTMDLVQAGVENSSLDVSQIGDNNYMSLTQRQTINDNFQLTQQGSGLSVTLERTGQGNQATLMQTGLSNTATLTQH